jgi:hypothetical protein
MFVNEGGRRSRAVSHRAGCSGIPGSGTEFRAAASRPNRQCLGRSTRSSPRARRACCTLRSGGRSPLLASEADAMVAVAALRLRRVGRPGDAAPSKRRRRRPDGAAGALLSVSASSRSRPCCRWHPSRRNRLIQSRLTRSRQPLWAPNPSPLSHRSCSDGLARDRPCRRSAEAPLRGRA